MQLDGTFDNRDTSSGSASPVSFRDDSLELVHDTPTKENGYESFSLLQFEPLFNLDDMSSSNSEGDYGTTNGVVFELGGDDDDEINGVDESAPPSPLEMDDEDSAKKSNRKEIKLKEEPTRQSSRGSKKAAKMDVSDDELHDAKQINGTSKADDRSTRKSSRNIKQSPAKKDEDDEVQKTPKKVSPRRGRKSGSSSPRSGGRKSPHARVPSGRRTREDIEAQRQLHRELLDEESEEDDDDSDDDDDDDEDESDE
jgi:hypothetical protein